jgi:hypothetical protein
MFIIYIIHAKLNEFLCSTAITENSFKEETSFTKTTVHLQYFYTLHTFLL